MAVIIEDKNDITGTIQCGSNPDYPAASINDQFQVIQAGKIGGASGVAVSVGDLVKCLVTNNGGNQAAVGDKFLVIQGNLEQATESAVGYAKIATQSAVDTGTNDTDYVTPLKLKTYVDSRIGSAFTPADGTAAAPSYSWASSTNYGMYRNTAESGIGWSLAGTRYMNLSNGNLSVYTNITSTGSGTFSGFMYLNTASGGTVGGTLSIVSQWEGANGVVVRGSASNYSGYAFAYKNSGNTFLWYVDSTGYANAVGVRVRDFDGVTYKKVFESTATGVLDVSKDFIATDIYSSNNSARIAKFLGVASAVNYWTFENSISGSQVRAVADGTDTNVGIRFVTKGTGIFTFLAQTAAGSGAFTFQNSITSNGAAQFSFYNSRNGNTSNTSELRLVQQNGSNAATCNTYVWAQGTTITSGSEQTKFGIDVMASGVRTTVFEINGTVATILAGDGAAVLGNGRIFAGVTGNFTGAHSTNANNTDYFWRQNSAGTGNINAKSGGQVNFLIGGTGGTTIGKYDINGLYFKALYILDFDAVTYKIALKSLATNILSVGDDFSNGVKIINKFGFGVTPVVQQTGGAATAGAAYTATEQSMIQKAYDTLRAFGFLS